MNEYTAVITISIMLGVFMLFALLQVIKRAIITRHIRRAAKACIGEGVSIFFDKGAKLAYRGIYSFLDGDFSKAIKCLEKSLKYSYVPQNCSFCYDWIARCYDAQDKTTEALTYSVKAVQAEPSNIKSLFNLAEMYARDGAFEKSHFYYNMVHKYDSKNPQAYFMQGMLSMGIGNYDEAREHFLKTVELEPKFHSAYSELSVIAAIEGDYSQADSYRAKADAQPFGNFTNSDSERLQKRLNSIKRIQELCHDC